MTDTVEDFQPYDSEVLAAQEVLAALTGRTYKKHNLAAFDREIVERFAERGLRVDVKWFTTTAEGVYSPQVDLIGRCEPLTPGEFDHDRMRHEIVNNVLSLPSEDAGLIKTPEKWSIKQAKEIHKHGPGCGH